MDDRVLSEDWFLLSMGPKKVGKSYGSLRSLIMSGRRSASGVVVHLDYACTEGGMATSVEALERFRRMLNVESQGGDEDGRL